MQGQVQELIEEMIPQIREEILKELRPQYESQYQEQLNQAMQEIQGSQFKEQQIEEKKRELAQQILYQIEQEFEQEKQSLIHNVSVSLSKSRSMQALEQQLRSKIEKEYAGYVEEETRKKTHLIRLNCSKKFEEDRAEMKQQLTDEFTEKLQIHLEKLEQTKQQTTQEYQNQKDKLIKIEAEAQQFQSMKNNQENNYGEQIQSMHDQIRLLTEQLQQIKVLKIPKQKPIKKQPTEVEEIQQQTSPFSSALKNQVLQECIPYEGLDIINFEQLPDLFHLELKKPTEKKDNQNQQVLPQQYESNQITRSDLAYTVNTQINTHDSQVISFNVSQPSMAKTNPHVTQPHITQPQDEKEKEKENQPSQNKDPISIKENDFKKSSISNQSAIIEKLENLCKEKTRKSQMSSIQKSSKILHQQDQFEELFKPEQKDSQHTRNIKLLRQELQDKFLEDLQLEDYYYQQISFLKFNFIQQFQKSMQQEITEQVHQLTTVWNKGHLSYSERIEYIKRIMDSSDSQSELTFVLEECLEYYQSNELLIEKLQQRQSFRSQIIKENCLIQKNKKIFQALRGLTYEIKQILKSKFFWREVDVDSILMIDQLEQQLIEREEMKEDIRRKVEKKFK